MNKLKKVLILIVLFLTIILSNYQVFAINTLEDEIEISQKYLDYLELTTEEKQNVIAPRMYDITTKTIPTRNPFRLVRSIGSSVKNKYSLREIIPENMKIKNQNPTNTCWAFASIASLESNLALQDYKYGRNKTIYDFSERHMDYATSREFLNNQINEFGFNRSAGTATVSGVPIAYLTNGLGAISEEEMPFEMNSDFINLSEIQNKDVITQVNDIIIFPSYSAEDDKTQIKQQMKEHIMNYGAFTANIHSPSIYMNDVYNAETAALYCNNSTLYKINHAVAVVGWNDEYEVENFVEGNRPINKGAWIVKNSYGSAFGDEGFIYISYEDVNIYDELTGIISAQSEIEYENIYQYDEFGGFLKYKNNKTSKLYLATEFDKKTTGKEYLTQVSINAPETYTCKVYVNPNGTSKEIANLQQVELKTGETETFEAGYHTIEFLNPVKINGESFVVVLEIEGAQENFVTTMIEFNYGEFYTAPKYATAASRVYNNVTIADGKCFVAKESEFNKGVWRATSKTFETSGGKIPNYDTTIKAFTTSNVLESIEITTLPSKVTYVEGQDFDSTGMEIKGYFANGKVIDITDYILQDATNLTLGQNSITIYYNGFMIKQPIEVVANTVESLEITTPASKTEYWAGEDFDSTDMIVEAMYKDGTRKIINDYIIQDGKTLKNDQITVTIEYEGKIVAQEITVQYNSVEKIEITKQPNKVNYVAGQNFDSDGMIVLATYKNGETKDAKDYVIKDGKNLSVGQEIVTIEYEGQTATQVITVVEKAIIGISIKEMPTKKEYTQYREKLDLTGGTVEILYNDDTKEDMQMTSEEIVVTGFDSEIAGVQKITLSYKDIEVQFDIVVKELPKPENSKFDDTKVDILGIKAYYFSDKNKKGYTVLNIQLENLKIYNKNENAEYYYYLSTRQNEENINNWVKINSIQIKDDKMKFDINTLDITNYQEIENADKTYLYVKEVATKNGMKSESITTPFLLEAEISNIEQYLDGEKKVTNIDDNSKPGNEIDNTLAPGRIPDTGKNLLIIFLIIIIASVGRISYKKYKDIKLR